MDCGYSLEPPRHFFCLLASLREYLEDILLFLYQNLSGIYYYNNKDDKL